MNWQPGKSNFAGAIAAICFAATTARAQGDTAADTRPHDASTTNSGTQTATPGAGSGPPLWEAGLFGFGITQAAYPGSDERVSRALALPFLVYRGSYLRAERGTVGLRALKTPRTELDVGFAATPGSQSSDIAARRGMADLGTLIEFGPRLKVNLGDVSSSRRDSRLQFPLREVIDVSHGFVSRGIAFEPQWVTDTRLPGRWLVSTSLGAMFGDRRLGDTFYGVAPGEATPIRSSYTASGGLIALRANLFAAHPLTPDVSVFYSLRIESLAGAANLDSPLVRRRAGWGAVVGLSWTLARSAHRASE
ncbi:MAG: MipA/OmpV family protein [Gallionella sp.]